MPIEYLPSSDPTAKVIVLDYKDLIDPSVDLSDAIKEAYGFEGLGLLAIRGVPQVTELRKNLLPLAHKFAGLPEDIKKKTIHEASFYSFGWSHGKEMLEGKPDYSKGSYYNNPVYNKPIEDEEMIKKYPAFCHPNIWPSEDMPEMEAAFLAMGRLVVDVGTLLALHCDKYVRKVSPTYEDQKLHQIIKMSKTPKGRLLHYFPLENPDKITDVDVSSWCGWHNDHGSLTGLVPAMYINAEGKEVPNPDPKSGLYIRTRTGKLVKANVPADHLAFQIGETAQVHSGGVLQATPHCVMAAQGSAAIGVSRETFAVFMEPMFGERMNPPEGVSAEEVTKGSSQEFLPKGVPLLSARWNEKMDFGEFTEKTLKSYY